MANGIRGDVTKAQVLGLLARLDACRKRVMVYEGLPDSAIGWDCWKAADASDRDWIMGEVDAPCFGAAERARDAIRDRAREVRDRIVSAAHDAYMEEYNRSRTIVGIVARNLAIDAAVKRRAATISPAWDTFYEADRAAQTAYDAVIANRDTYRCVLRHVKSIYESLCGIRV